MEEASFRRATAGDRAALVGMARALRLEDGPPPDARAARAFPEGIDAALHGDPWVRVWMIEQRATAVGYLVVTFGFSVEAGGRDAFIDELYLQPEARGRGLGRRALDFAESECRPLGVRRVNLEVERGNQRAKALYEAQGFRDHRRFLMSKWL